jgi:hypothetical protein
MNIKNLNTIVINSDKIELVDVLNEPKENKLELQILPGKYQILECSEEKTDTEGRKINDLFIIHESLNKDLSKHHWIKTDSFHSIMDDDENSIAFLGIPSDYNEVNVEFEPNDSPIKIIENGVFFGFLYNNNNDGLNYSTTVENGVIKGFKIEIDTLSNELNRQFIEACSNCDIENVRVLTENHAEKINIHYAQDSAFYWACRNGDGEVLNYLLFSKDLKENVEIDEKFPNTINAFSDFCREHLRIVESLIFNHNLPKTPTIEKILNTSSYENFNIIENMFRTKEIIDEKYSLEKELDTKEEFKNKKPKM